MMTEEDKELLLKDLCARQPYGVKVQYNNEIYDIDYISALYEEVHLDISDNYTIGVSEIKPYLRPMSSMTEEEKSVLLLCNAFIEPHSTEFKMDFYNQHYLDYRDLIEKGLALEAPKGMYIIK